MENRSNGIKEQIDHAENKLKEAENVKKQYEEMLKSAHVKADEIIKAAKDRANKEYENTVSNAHHDAQAIIERANQSIELERQRVMKEMRNEITSLAFSAASKLIQKNMDTDENRKVVENFLNEKGVA
jgi:F-type H+-transporting ATPase subunit b